MTATQQNIVEFHEATIVRAIDNNAEIGGMIAKTIKTMNRYNEGSMTELAKLQDLMIKFGANTATINRSRAIIAAVHSAAR